MKFLDRVKLQKIEIHKFFFWAFCLMVIMTCLSVNSYIETFNLLPITQKIYGFFSLLMSGLWGLFYWWLWQNAIPKKIEMSTDNQMLEQLKGGQNAKITDIQGEGNTAGKT